MSKRIVCFLSKNSEDLTLIPAGMKTNKQYVHFQHISQSCFYIRPIFRYELTGSTDPKSKTNEHWNTAHLGGSLAKSDRTWNLFSSKEQVCAVQSKNILPPSSQSHQLLNPLLNANRNELKLLVNICKTHEWSALKCQCLSFNMLIIYA